MPYSFHGYLYFLLSFLLFLLFYFTSYLLFFLTSFLLLFLSSFLFLFPWFSQLMNSIHKTVCFHMHSLWLWRHRIYGKLFFKWSKLLQFQHFFPLILLCYVFFVLVYVNMTILFLFSFFFIFLSHISFLMGFSFFCVFNLL